jgi:hypothetical protein
MPNAHPRPWHREARFGDGPRIPMCRERRAVWRARLHLFRRARKITPLFEDIGLAMIRRLGTDGRLDPSHQTIADDTGCDPRTVRRALVAFRSCGLALWVQRLVRDGWRTSQASNAYALTIGESSAVSAQVGPKLSGGQRARQTRLESSLLPPASPAEVAAARDALARRRAAVEGRLLTRGAAATV